MRNSSFVQVVIGAVLFVSAERAVVVAKKILAEVALVQCQRREFCEFRVGDDGVLRVDRHKLLTTR
jgi:hypothetical protein